MNVKFSQDNGASTDLQESNQGICAVARKVPVESQDQSAVFLGLDRRAGPVKVFTPARYAQTAESGVSGSIIGQQIRHYA
jgi:hypothetical protein